MSRKILRTGTGNGPDPDRSGLTPDEPVSAQGPGITESHDHEGHVVSRRRLLEMSALSGAAIGIGAVTHAMAGDATQEASPEASPAASPAASPDAMSGMDMTPQHANTNTGFVNFVPYHITILRAACNRIIPTDATGPGAEEAGVVYFIDREMGSRKAFRGPRYMQGPFVKGEATQGDQSALMLRDRFRLGLNSLDTYAKATNNGTGFADLPPEKQDAILTDMSTGKVDEFGSSSIDKTPLSPMAKGGQPGITAQAFFGLLLSYTMAGFFSDPVHGGNRDMVGWKLIGFPGAHLSWADQIENYNQPFKGDYISLGQYQQQIGGES